MIEKIEGLFHADYRETLGAVEGRADLLLFSPPYGKVRHYGGEVGWCFADYQALGEFVQRALNPEGGQALVVLDGPTADFRGDGFTERSLMPYRVLLDWRDRLGLIVPDVLMYRRDGFTGAFPQGFRNEFEALLWFATPGPRTFHKERCPVPRRDFDSRPRRTASDPCSNGSNQRPASPGGRSPADLREGMKHRGNVWDYGAVGSNKGGCAALDKVRHPAPFPYRLARDVVLIFSDPGDLVVDPFLGRGTSMLAALDHGRRFLGGDLYGDESGVPWVQVARGVAEDRYAQGLLFSPEWPASILPLMRKS